MSGRPYVGLQRAGPGAAALPGVLADGWEGLHVVTIGTRRATPWLPTQDLPEVAGNVLLSVTGFAPQGGYWERRWLLGAYQTSRVGIAGLMGVRAQVLRSTLIGFDVFASGSADAPRLVRADTGYLATSVVAGTYPAPPGATAVFSSVAIPSFLWIGAVADGGADVTMAQTFTPALEVPVRAPTWSHGEGGDVNLLWRIRLA